MLLILKKENGKLKDYWIMLMNEYLDLCGISQHTRDISRNRNKPLTHNKSRKIPRHNTLGDLLGLTREEQKDMVNRQKAISRAKVIMKGHNGKD